MATKTHPADSSAVTLSHIQHYHDLSLRVLEKIRSNNIMGTPPRTGPTFKIGKVTSLVGRSESAIRQAEREGRLPNKKRADNKHREGYTLAEIDHIRDVFKTRPWRDDSDPTAIIAFQNFKGGVGKSTLSVHAAQDLAIKGYRVLLIDADAQASSTMMFGHIPDTDIDPEDTIASLLRGTPTRGIRELIRKTHYHNLDLIPANLHLYLAEYEIAARIRGQGFGVLQILSQEIQRIAHEYDVIILDPPPALGMVSLSVLQAANALVIPMPPSIIDFASTASFLGMLSENMSQLYRYGMSPAYGFIQIVLSKADSSVAHNQIAEMVNSVFGRIVFDTTIKSSAEYGNASQRLQSVFDLDETITHRKVRTRCLEQMESFGADLERQIKALWPSKSREEV